MDSGYARLRCARRPLRNGTAHAGQPPCPPEAAPRIGANPSGPTARRRAVRPRRHPGTRFERSEAPRIRDLFLAHRQIAGGRRRHRIRAGAVGVAEWIPDTPASAALGGRCGMTRRMPGSRRVHPKRPHASAPTPAARPPVAAPSVPDVIPARGSSEAKSLVSGIHASPVDRWRTMRAAPSPRIPCPIDAARQRQSLESPSTISSTSTNSTGNLSTLPAPAPQCRQVEARHEA